MLSENESVFVGVNPRPLLAHLKLRYSKKGIVQRSKVNCSFATLSGEVSKVCVCCLRIYTFFENILLWTYNLHNDMVFISG